MELSLDAPFWSLHLELYGSLLVLCLVTLRTWSVVAHDLAVVAATATFATHPMFLFVVGHLLRPAAVSQPANIGSKRYGGIALLLLGFALCTTKDWRSVEWLRQTLCQSEPACAPSLFQFQSQLGAIAVYLGVLLSPAVWRFLGSAPCRHLGRLSFSIYLLHFPILFTIVSLGYIAVPSVGIAFLLFLALTLLAAIAFERIVDRPAIALSRRVDRVAQDIGPPSIRDRPCDEAGLKPEPPPPAVAMRGLTPATASKQGLEID